MVLLVFVGMKDMHLKHKDLNSSHKISIGVDVEKLLKISLLKCAIVSLIVGISALFHRMIFLGLICCGVIETRDLIRTASWSLIPETVLQDSIREGLLVKKTSKMF